MKEIEETRLPGVGLRHDFITTSGRRIGVISHHSGHQELLIYDRRDPDSTSETIRLEEEDSRTLDELLSPSLVTERLTSLRQTVEGLTIDWVPIAAGAAAAGRTIGDTQLRRRTGVSIVAVVRGERTIPSPTPEERLEAGDTAVVVGTPQGIQQAFALLRGE